MDFFSKFKKSDEANPTSEPDTSSYATDTYSSGDVTKRADASDEYEKPGSYGVDEAAVYPDKPSGGGDAVGTYASDKYDQSGGGYGEDTEGGCSKKPSYVGVTAENDGYQQPGGGYGEDTEEGFSKKPTYGGATTETDEYDLKPEGEYGEDTEQGFSKKLSYVGATTEIDEYDHKPEGEYGKDTVEGFSKKPSYGGATTETDEYDQKPEGEYGEEAAADDLSEKPAVTETDSYGKYTSTEDFPYTPSGDDAAIGTDSGDADAAESYRKKPSGGYGVTTCDYATDDKYNE